MMVKLKIKKGDKVKVIAGNERGKEGLVTEVITKDSRVVVDGLNIRKKHNKPSAANPQGGITEFSDSIHISNVQLIDPKKNVPTKVGRVADKKGKLQRVAKKSGEVIK